MLLDMLLDMLPDMLLDTLLEMFDRSLSGFRVDTVSTLVLMLSRRWEVDEENWFLKC